MKKNLKILFLFDSPVFIPRGHDFSEFFRDEDWKTESDVYKALRANGYEISCLGIHNDISLLIEEIAERRPDVVFSQMEVFDNKTSLEKNVIGLIELLGIPCTGASPSGLNVCNDKAMSKKILSYHNINVPRFQTFYKGRIRQRGVNLKMPVIVKPLVEEASRGISLGSVVSNEGGLARRLRFVHKRMGLDAIVEEYIKGREFYVGVIGNRDIDVFPPIELKFGKRLSDKAKLATYKAKWDGAYRKRWGIKNSFPGRLPKGIRRLITDTCRHAYKALDINSYARFDLRLTSDGKIYVLEANANPNLARYEDFSLSAEKGGVSYPALIKKIVHLALRRRTGSLHY